MKTSISIATFLLAGSGVAGVAAANLPSPFQGSDTLFDITQAAITAIGTIGPASAYIGGGSGNGQSAMFGNSQGEAPMSRMINNGASICTYDAGGNGQTNASGIVIALDAVDVLASALTGADASTCNVPDGGGLVHNNGTGTPLPDGGVGPTFANYKGVLALLYLGEKNGSGVQDCNTQHRQDLVANWNLLFQDNCTNACNDGTHGGALWHAFRRDDASGTSDVFAGILGGAGPSASASGGFGSSPYCNVINWDTSTANANCVLHAGLQFTGPGGVTQGGCSNNGVCSDGTFCNSTTACANGSTCQAHAPCWLGYAGGVCGGGTSALVGAKCATPDGTTGCDPANPATVCLPQCGTFNGAPDTCVDIETALTSGRATTTHRRPPLDTYGDNPDPNGGAGNPAIGTATRSADVYPTSMQDNDPIRHKCIGGPTNNTLRAGEEVCNRDGTLGVVLPMAASDFLLKVAAPMSGLVQFPTNVVNNTRLGAPPGVHNCALRAGQTRGGSRHGGQCPNGDQENLAKCAVPVDQNLTANGSSQCVTQASTNTAKLRNITWDGRVWNLHMHDGTGVDGSIGYAIETIPTTAPNATGTFCGDGSACTPTGAACADGSACLVRVSLDFTGGFVRIHQVQTVPANTGACQMQDATDQIGCLVHADRCTIGYAGDGARSWAARSPVGKCTGSSTTVTLPCKPVGGACGTGGTCSALTNDNDSLVVNNIAASTATVQLLGQLGEYPLSRKLYLNSLGGFAFAPGDPELQLAKFEAQGQGSTMSGLVTSNGFFLLGDAGPQGPDTPFCEDFNQHTICGAAINDNACNRMPGNSGVLLPDGGFIPGVSAAAMAMDGGLPGDPDPDAASSTTSTVCGNGKVESYEECDPSTPFTCDDGTACTVQADGGGNTCATGPCRSNRTWNCSVPGATVCSSTCRC
jgi:hypothetical protein